MSPMSKRERPCVARFPRVSGDEPLAVAIEGGSLTFSPRERG